MAIPFEVATFSETGRRDRNEDAFGSARSDDGRCDVFAVADGLGGHDDGEVASAAAIAAVADGLRALAVASSETDGEPTLGAVAAELFERAHAAVERAREERGGSDMATTLALVLARDDRVVWGHVGDSRIYRLRGGRAERLTRDHTAAESMRALDGANAKSPVDDHTNTLLATIGMPDRFNDIADTEALLDGDAFLLCTDGVWVHLSESEIAAEAADAAGAAEWVERLRTRVDAAAGAMQDNYTALAVCAGTWATVAPTKQTSLLRRIFGR